MTPLALRLVFALAVGATLVVAGTRPARAAATYVDRRVSAIPTATLLSDDPRQLVDERRQGAARSLDRERRIVFFVWVFSQVLALVTLWRSGYSARFRLALSRAIRNPVAVRFLFGAAVATVAALAALPSDLIDLRYAVEYGIAAEPPVRWARDLVVSWLLLAIVIGILSAFIYTLVARTRLWYMFAAVGLFALVLGADFVQPIAVAPLFERFRPLAPSTRAAVAINALERRLHIAAAPIMVEERSARSPSVSATVTGLGPTKRIVLSGTLLDDATPGEVTFLAARELSHYVHGDVFRLALAQTLAFVATVTLAVFLADRIGFRRDDDALSRLPLVGATLGLVALVTFPLYNAYARGVEASADRSALELTSDPAAAVRLYVRVADESLVPFCVSELERTYFLDRPPLGTRAAAALHRPDPCR